MVEVRLADPKIDAAAFGELQRRKSQEEITELDHKPEKTNWESVLSRDALILIAKNEEGKIIATGGTKILKDQQTANWRGLYVLPEERRKGVATSLVKEMLRLLANRGIRRVITEIEGNNTASLIQHKKIGFSEYEEATDQQGNHYHRLEIFL